MRKVFLLCVYATAKTQRGVANSGVIPGKRDRESFRLPRHDGPSDPGTDPLFPMHNGSAIGFVLVLKCRL